MEGEATHARSAAGTSSLASGAVQYELRIGVTGHRELADSEAVDRAVRNLLRHVVNVLEFASAEPFGPHGTPQSRIDRFDRLLTRCVSAGTRIAAPVLDALVGAAVAPLRWIGLGGRRPYCARVPFSPGRPRADRQTTLKVTVISALAKGADQIVARAVCDLVQPALRNRYLEAVLPFPQKVYEEDFATGEDLAAFRELLAFDKGRLNTHPQPTVLFPDFPACPDPENPAFLLSRDKAYAAAGRYVVETSEIIVAIWDPAREEKPGGTAATVRYAVDRGRLVLWLNPAHLDSGAFLLRPLTHPGGMLDRKGDNAHARWPAQLARSWRRFWHGSPADSEQAAGKVVQQKPPAGLRLEPVPMRAKQLSRHFHRLSAYNRDSAVNEDVLQQEVRDHVASLERVARKCELPGPATRAIVEALLPHVVRADHLSIRYQRLRDSAAWLWPSAAALVVSLMAFQIIFLPDHYWLAFVELAVLLLGYVSYRVSLHDAWHDKWLNDRRLAEGLRGAMFTTLLASDDESGQQSGSRASPAGVFGQIQDPLPFYNPANAWFVATLKRVLRKERRRFAESIDLANADHRRAVASFITEGWIRDQAAYHERHASSRRRVVVWSKRLRLAMIVSLIAVAALHAFGVGHESDHQGQSSFARFDLWVAFATVALPAWAAAFHVMLALDDHERLAERSALMAPLLHGLADQLEHVESLAQLRECVAEAERIMDLESREWAESLVDRKPEFTG